MTHLPDSLFYNDLTMLEICVILRQHTMNSCIVGGFVRDQLLGVKSHDIDIVTDVPYDKLIEIFTEAGWGVKEVGKQFLVINVSKNGRTFEIANYRKDGTYVDGRRPESCEIGTLEDDAMRRDFTINALYMNINTFELLDPTRRGLSDIANRILRFIGSSEARIREDYLRAFRFYRLLNNKRLTPDSRSLKAVRRLFDEACRNTEPERIRQEMEKLACGNTAQI